MAWDPAVLRKYNTTGHFRLLNQLRSELKGNPLIRPKDGETVGAANRSRSLTRALENRASGGYGRSRRAQNAQEVVVVAADPRLPDSVFPQYSIAWPGRGAEDPAENLFNLDVEETQTMDSESESGGFRSRLRAIDLR
ncbi:MAG: hypothetical protein NTW51_16630 [Cyanobacteria bacterium]|nr:hypothetical protein [Cyanobacteriota bacterium]